MRRIPIFIAIVLLVSGCASYDALNMSTLELAQKIQREREAEAEAGRVAAKEDYDRRNAATQVQANALLASGSEEFRLLVTNPSIKNNRKPSKSESELLLKLYDIQKTKAHDQIRYFDAIASEDERPIVDLQRNMLDAALYYFRQLQERKIGYADYHSSIQTAYNDAFNQENLVRQRINQQRSVEYANYRETLKNISALEEASYQQQRRQQAEYQAYRQIFVPSAPESPKKTYTDCTRLLNGDVSCTSTSR